MQWGLLEHQGLKTEVKPGKKVKNKKKILPFFLAMSDIIYLRNGCHTICQEKLKASVL